MSDKIKKLTNVATLVGKIAEFETKTGLNKDKVPYVSVKGALQFGESSAQTKRFEKYVQEANKEGKENKMYPKILAFSKSVKSIADTSYEEATTVSIQGSLAANDYMNDQDELKEGIKIDASFFNDYNAGDEFKGTLDVEGYIQTIAPEVKGEDKEETGRLRVTLLTTDFFGNVVPVKNIVVPKELKKAFEDGYEVGQTAKFYLDFVVNKGEAKPKKTGGLGTQRETDGKSYVEMILTGADPAIEEDANGAVSKEAIRIALAERKAMLEKLKDSGYQGGKGKSISTARTSGVGSTKPAPANDEDIPF